MRRGECSERYEEVWIPQSSEEGWEDDEEFKIEQEINRGSKLKGEWKFFHPVCMKLNGELVFLIHEL